MLYKLKTECTFTATRKIYKRVENVSMGAQERDIALSLKPKFNQRFVDDKKWRIKENEPDQLFSKRSSCHLNIKITFNINPSKFLGTNSRNYKSNAIVEDLHRANKISSNLKQKISIFKAKYTKVDYPNAIIKYVIKLIIIRTKTIFSSHQHYLKNAEKNQLSSTVL